MDRISQFPIDIEKSTIEEKKKFFLEHTINHPMLHRAYLKVQEKVNDAPNGKVFLVFGPTGVGKSTLCKRMKNDLILKHLSNDDRNNSVIPVVSLELPSPDNGKFNWKDLYKRMLKEIREPLIENKVDKNQHGRKKKIPNYYPTTSPELRESLENAITHRKTKIVLLDEAQHLLKVSGAKSIIDQMDTIKSIANLTGSNFIMFGTYELLDFLDLNGQLGRRTDEVHLQRYDIRIPSERNEFKSVVNTFQNLLPFLEESVLLTYWELLYERTIGSTGILKEWLDRCVIDALNSNHKNITYEHLVKHAPTPRKALKIAQEIIAGEEKLQEQEEIQTLLRATVGLDSVDLPTENGVEEKRKKNQRDVGKRNPTRDEVGIRETGT
ncbi:ATP-binding protein [Bacillus salipaludis]|uniref:ATP-binding protein n=1 Tax=Bacillus salipaludis TaxID=2547811 RepID=A0ABW8R9I3_9BACI